MSGNNPKGSWVNATLQFQRRLRISSAVAGIDQSNFNVWNFTESYEQVRAELRVLSGRGGGGGKSSFAKHRTELSAF